MSSIIGIIAIIIAFAALVYLSFKGFSIMYVAPICAVFVVVCSGMAPLEVMNTSFMEGINAFIANVLFIFLLSLLMGRVYISSGAAMNIARTLFNTFTKRADSTRKKTISIFICFAVSFGMCYGGIDTFCAMFTLFPVVYMICREANIPRRFIPILMMLGFSTAALTPGAPLMINSLPIQLLGTTSAAGLIPGLISTAIMVGVGGLYLVKRVHKAAAAGEVFEPGNIKMPPERPADKYPHFVVALIPLVVVLVLFNVLNNLVPALSAGLILSLILLGPKIDPEEGLTRGRTVINTLNEGGRQASEALMMGAVVMAFAMVVMATPAFQVILGGMMGLQISEYLLVALAIAILVGITGAPPAGITILVPMMAKILTIPVEAIHRISVISACTFETLPFQGSIIILLKMAGLKHKESYPPILFCTVLLPVICSILAAILYSIFPNMI